MLILTRKAGQRVMIGDGVEVTIQRISGSRVIIAIAAPKETSIRRSEIPPKNHKDDKS